MERYDQEPPYCIQIEFSEGCNLYCPFCGLTGVREKSEKNFKFATPETIQKVADRIKEAGWNCRIELAQHGEPTMNPRYIEYVGILRETLPRLPIMMTSNGGGLLKGDVVENIQALFKNGLNVLAIDEYEYVTLYKKIRKELAKHTNFEDPWDLDEELINGGIEIFEYPKNKKGNPHYRRKHGDKHLCLVKDISVATKGTHSNLNNHCGSGSPLDFSPSTNRQLNAKCAKPFREITVDHSGTVNICCNDWQRIMPVGNLHEMSLEEIWQHDLFQAARYKLYHGQRDFPPCAGCNARSERPGLLPDKKGKISLAEPDEECNGILFTAAEKGVENPDTPPVTEKGIKTLQQNQEVIMNWKLGF